MLLAVIGYNAAEECFYQNVWSNCVMCDSKKSKFIKQQKNSRLLSKLRIKYQSKGLIMTIFIINNLLKLWHFLI